MLPKLFFLFFWAASTFFPSGAQAKNSITIYWELRGVKEPAGTKPPLVEKAKATFSSEVKKYPEVLTKLGDPPLKGDALNKALEEKKITGYGLILRIVKAKHSLNPPPKGKVYRVLMAEVKVALDAEKIPSGQMALAGEGEAQVATEVSRYNEKDRNQLIIEGLNESIKQAVKKSVLKLTTSEKPTKKRRARKRRKRNRR